MRLNIQYAQFITAHPLSTKLHTMITYIPILLALIVAGKAAIFPRHGGHGCGRAGRAQSKIAESTTAIIETISHGTRANMTTSAATATHYSVYPTTVGLVYFEDDDVALGSEDGSEFENAEFSHGEETLSTQKAEGSPNSGDIGENQDSEDSRDIADPEKEIDATNPSGYLTPSSSLFSSPTPPTAFIPGVGFQIIIHDPPVVPPVGIEMSPEIPVWDIDMFQASRNASLIPALKAQGKTVICYFNAGAVHEYDDDISAWPLDDGNVVGDAMQMGPAGDEFDGEFWINVANPTAIGLMQKRVILAAHIGCDGVDPDNVDGWTRDTGFSLPMSAYADLISSLAETAHANDIMIGLKNSPEMADQLLPTVDFVVLETCLEYGDTEEEFCGVYQRFIAAGKPVFNIEYPDSAYNGIDGVNSDDYDMVW